MKKIFATILALAMMLTAFSAFAENNTGLQNGPAGFPPQMSGEKPADAPERPDSNGEKPADAPEMPDFNGEKPADAPEMPDFNGEKPADAPEMPDFNGEKPANAPERPDSNGEKPSDSSRIIDFDQMVTDGVISEETRSRILEYMEAHKPADVPEMPDFNDEKPSDLPDINVVEHDLLKELLDAEVITQAEYEALVAANADTAQADIAEAE